MSLHCRILVRVAVSSALGLTLSMPSMAADAQLEEIIVTAQKRTQSLLSVPISITALAGDNLSKLGITEFVDYLYRVPGLGFSSVGTFGNRGNRQINLRGISSNVGSPTVGYYIDETPMRFVDPRLFDLERVEVLRGPQGTLYGAGSMGGAIRVITNKPDSSAFDASVAGTLSYTDGGEENYAMNGMVNVPLAEGKAALRVVAYYQQDGGYVDNRPEERQPLPEYQYSESAAKLIDVRDNYNDEDSSGVRAVLTVTPTEQLTIEPGIYYQSTTADAWTTYVAEMGDLKSNFLEMSPHEETFTIYSLNVSYDFGWAELLSASSYSEYELLTTEPFDRVLPGALGLPFPYVAPYRTNEEQEVFTQELRLTSTGSGPWKWIGGLFYQQDDLTTKQRYVTPDINDDLFGGAPVVPGGRLFVFDAEREESQFAVFGETTYSVTPKLDLTAGLRWFDNDSDRYAVADGLFNGGESITDVNAAEDGFTPKVQASYRTNENTMVFATIAKGYRPGFGTVVPPPGLCDADLAAIGVTNPSDQVDSDELWSYEVGSKASLMDRRLTIQGAVYFNQWDDLQQSIDLPTCGFVLSANAGKAESKGFELEVNAMPIDGLVLDLAIGYVDAELTESAPGLGAQSGDRLVYVPDWSFSVGATYTHAIAAQMEAFYHADYQYSGDMTFNYDPSVPDLYQRDAFGTGSLRAGLKKNQWQVAAFVDNVSDERPALGSLRFLTSGTLTYTLRPRTYGVNLSYEF